MSKLDLLKEYKSYYNAGKNPEIVKFDETNYLTIEGIGEPAGKMFVSKNELMAFIDANGISVNGKHHEIYLSDPRKNKPDKMKTIIRYPVK